MKTCPNCGHSSEEDFRFCPSCGTKSPDVELPQDSLIGRTLGGKYRILSEIGSGAMGTVYLSEHIGLRKKIAIKVLHSDLQLGEESLQRFQREGIAAGKFTHVNAIQIFDFDKAEGDVFFLAMEYVEGSNLKTFLRQRGRIPLEESLSIIRQVLGALAEAHRHGIIHRDLKPDNIMVTPGPTGELAVKVLDFGLSKLVDKKLSGGSLQTQVGRILGTPLYMAPEQCAGEEADVRSDLYAVGLVLYEMMSGLTPFPDESTTEILFTRTTREAPSFNESHPDLGIPVDLDAILQRALQRRREERFQTAAEMLAAVEAIRHDVLGPVRARRPLPDAPGGPRPAPPQPARRRGLLAVVALLLVAGLGTAGLFLFGGVKGGAPRAKRLTDIPRDTRTELENRYVDRLDEARRQLRMAQADLALSAVGDALGMSCHDSEAYLVRAEIHRKRGDPDAARLDFEEALSLDPDYAEAHAGMGWLALETAEPKEALRLFETAQEKDQMSAEARAGQGAALYELGNLEGAVQVLSQATGLDPDYAPAHRYLGLVRMAQGKLDEALDSLLRAKRGETDWRTSEALGRVYALQGNTTQAEREFGEALRRNPDATAVRLSLASMLVDQERWSEAKSELRAALGREPQAGELRILLGVCLYHEDRTAEAIGELERGLETAYDPKAEALLALLQHEAGRPREALASYERAVEADGVSNEVRIDHGLALFELQRFEEARDVLEEVLLDSPNEVLAHYALGILYMDYLGVPELARKHLSTYRDLGGDDQRVDGWLRRL